MISGTYVVHTECVTMQSTSYHRPQRCAVGSKFWKVLSLSLVGQNRPTAVPVKVKCPRLLHKSGLPNNDCPRSVQKQAPPIPAPTEFIVGNPLRHPQTLQSALKIYLLSSCRASLAANVTRWITKRSRNNGARWRIAMVCD